MTKLEKLLKAKELILEVEDDFIENKGFCPYEIGYAIRNLNEAINVVKAKYSNYTDATKMNTPDKK